MKRNERMDLIIRTTMEVVAESGLDTFSVKQVSEKARVNESLIYRDFGTRTHLLEVCYLTINHNLANIYSQVILPDELDEKMIMNTIHDMWLKYLDYMVEHKNETKFYSAYCNSSLGWKIKLNEDPEISTSNAVKATQRILLWNSDRNLKWKNIFNLYITDGTTIFAKRLIDGVIPDSPESREMIWLLFSQGIVNLIKDE